MSSDLEAGVPPGIESMLTDSFGVPATPSIGRVQAIERIRVAIKESSKPGLLRVSENPSRRGTLFDLFGRRVEFPAGARYDRCFIGLIDLDPLAAWAHAAEWVFVPSVEGEVVFVETDAPERAGGSVRLLPEER